MWCNMESKNDSIMLTFGIIVLLIALMGSAVFEGEEPEGNAGLFDVSFTENSGEIFSAADHTNEGQSWTSPMDVAGPKNITHLEFVLTWTDDDTSEAEVGGLGVQNQPDSFSLTVTMPNGTEHSEEGTSDINTKDGIITIIVMFQSFPENTFQVLSQSKETLQGELTKENGFGNWTISVTCEEAGDSKTTTGQTTAEDDGNDWDLRVTAVYYEATINEHEIQAE